MLGSALDDKMDFLGDKLGEKLLDGVGGKFEALQDRFEGLQDALGQLYLELGSQHSTSDKEKVVKEGAAAG